MSTTYMLRRPISWANMRALSQETIYPMKFADGSVRLTDGSNYVEPYFDEQTGDLVGFERYATNDPSHFVHCFDAVSEHDDSDCDYQRLFGGDDDAKTV